MHTRNLKIYFKFGYHFVSVQRFTTIDLLVFMFLGSRTLPVRRADKLTAIHESIV
jgi:hypothetical protein